MLINCRRRRQWRWRVAPNRWWRHDLNFPRQKQYPTIRKCNQGIIPYRLFCLIYFFFFAFLFLILWREDGERERAQNGQWKLYGRNLDLFFFFWILACVERCWETAPKTFRQSIRTKSKPYPNAMVNLICLFSFLGWRWHVIQGSWLNGQMGGRTNTTHRK